MGYDEPTSKRQSCGLCIASRRDAEKPLAAPYPACHPRTRHRRVCRRQSGHRPEDQLLRHERHLQRAGGWTRRTRRRRSTSAGAGCGRRYARRSDGGADARNRARQFDGHRQTPDRRAASRGHVQRRPDGQEGRSAVPDRSGALRSGAAPVGGASSARPGSARERQSRRGSRRDAGRSRHRLGAAARPVGGQCQSLGGHHRGGPGRRRPLAPQSRLHHDPLADRRQDGTLHRVSRQSGACQRCGRPDRDHPDSAGQDRLQPAAGRSAAIARPHARRSAYGRRDGPQGCRGGRGTISRSVRPGDSGEGRLHRQCRRR